MPLTRDQQPALRFKLLGLLGDLPAMDRPITATLVDTQPFGDGGIVETLSLDLNGCEPVPAYFVRAASSTKPAPVVLYNHAHGGEYRIGKEELLHSRPGMQQRGYAHDFLARGWSSLCIDTWAFGGRATRTESAIFKEMLWRGQVMWGMMVYDSLRAIDYLASRRDVDISRLATVGASMGSTMAWWTAALDQRVKVCVDICCLSDFQALLDTQAHDGHGVYYFVPSLLKHFDTATINSLIAPRHHLSIAGLSDPLTPPAGLDRIDAVLRNVYASMHAAAAWQLQRHDTGHGETTAMREAALSFLEANL